MPNQFPPHRVHRRHTKKTPNNVIAKEAKPTAAISNLLVSVMETLENIRTDSTGKEQKKGCK